MSKLIRACLCVAASAAAVTGVVPSTAGAARPHPSIRSIPHGLALACGLSRPSRHARCYAHVVTHPNSAKPLASSAPPATAYTPSQIAHGYGFDAIGCGTSCGQSQTIAIVDAYDAPHVAADLAAFDAQYGLPAPPSFQKVTPAGQAAPPYDSGWEEEISLDVEWAHAMAPGAAIVLEEAASSSYANLYGAVDDAVKRGAGVVSMSWGGGEYSGETTDDSHFKGSGVTFIASAGDSGHVTDYPAASPFVTAVGGTTLTLDTAGNRQGETAWSCSSSSDCNYYGGTGGDASSYEAEPAYQTSFANPSGAPSQTIAPGGKRGYADVSYDADPNTGVAIYDSGQGGWLQIGGTSAGAPQWSALVATVKALKSGASIGNTDLYSAAAGAGYAQRYHDVTSGQNGSCGSACTAAIGWDEPTGLGSPIAGTLATSLGAPPPPKLAFQSLPPSFTAGQAQSGTVQLETPTGSPLVATNPVTVTLTSTGSGAFSAGSVTIPAGSSSSGSFGYSDTKAESTTVTASASGYANGTQTENVTAGPATSLTISPTSATVGVGGAQAFTAAGKDQYGNSANVGATGWSTTAPGTVSPSNGSATTFNATAVGGGNVTATLGSLSASASVTVTSQLIANGNFETGTFAGWTTGGGKPTPSISTAQAHSPTHSALLGFTGSTGEPSGDSSIQQQFTVPASGGTLSFYVWEFTTDSVYYDWQTCQIRNSSGSTLKTLFKEAANGRSWQKRSYSLSSWAGQRIALWCNVHEDGYGDQTYMYVDDFTVG